MLELFESIWRTRNLTATGAALGLSQPAVSRGLACLREAYDDELFVRQQRGVEPTPLATSLAEPVASALSIVRATIDKPTFDPNTDTRTFRLALTDIGERHFMPQLSAWLAMNAPAVAIETTSPSQADLVAGLSTGDIDLAVGFLSGLGKQVHQQRLFREHLVYIARKGHPTVKGKLDAQQLRELPHVIGSPGGTNHATAVEKVLTSPRVRAAIKLRVHSFLTIGPIVGASNLVAVVPSRLAAMVGNHVGLQTIAPPVRFPGFEISMVWHKRFNRDPGNTWLRGVFQTLFAQE
ncbi:miscellaneous; not classified regulator [plant metagenome]|uniref:Miscellaneous not classified regulator n=1 Tax=plant metagenome TaxID=1297885 RepID=A0A484Q2B4_9ZZZZ